MRRHRLRPEKHLFEAVLEGWHAQQATRNLALSTIDGRVRTVMAFGAHVDAFVWVNAGGHRVRRLLQAVRKPEARADHPGRLLVAGQSDGEIAVGPAAGAL